MIVTLLIVVQTYVAVTHTPILKSEYVDAKFAYTITRMDANDINCIHIYFTLLSKIQFLVPSNVSTTATLCNNKFISFRVLFKEVARLLKLVIPRNTNSETSNCFFVQYRKEEYQTCRTSGQSTALLQSQLSKARCTKLQIPKFPG